MNFEIFTREELAINIYKNTGTKELATNRFLEWLELAPNWKQHYLDIADYILQINQRKN